MKRYEEYNRKAWNYAMHLHQKANKNKYDEMFQNSDNTVFCSLEQAFLLKQVVIKGKRIIHLCCNNGVELMSFYNLQAAYCCGVDICDEAIIEAKERCNKLGYPIEFIRANVYDIQDIIVDKFDLVYISVGTIRWLHDLECFFNICYQLLKPKGKMYIHDVHPIAEIINDDRVLKKSPMEIITSYNRKEELFDFGSLDYIGHTDNRGERRVWFIHSFTDIIGSLLKNNFRINYFEENEKDIAEVYHLVEKSKVKVPLSFKLVVVKE